MANKWESMACNCCGGVAWGIRGAKSPQGNKGTVRCDQCRAHCPAHTARHGNVHNADSRSWDESPYYQGGLPFPIQTTRMEQPHA